MTSGPEGAANVAAIASCVAHAASLGAQYVQLPENALAMGATAPPVDEDDHPGVFACRELAARHAVWLHVGSVAVRAEAGRAFNRSLLIAPSGAVAQRYDKLHLFDATLRSGEAHRESDRFVAGEAARLADLPFGVLGLSICYDVRFPELYRVLARGGAQIIAVPSAFTAMTGAAHWHVLLRARAIETGCFVLAAAQCGVHASDRRTYGHSLIVSPWGKVLADAGAEPGVVWADLDLGEVEAARAQLPVLQHARAPLAVPALRP